MVSKVHNSTLISMQFDCQLNQLLSFAELYDVLYLLGSDFVVVNFNIFGQLLSSFDEFINF